MMKKEWLMLALVLVGIIFISGCADQDGEIVPEYKDEALKMEIEVTDRVLPNQAINMKVRLTNQVRDDVENVEFRVTDFYGLVLVNQRCPIDPLTSSTLELRGPSACGFISTLCGCGPFNIQSLDEEEMSFVFRVPSQEEVARIGRELEPEFTLEYDYSGETTYLIPIISQNERSTSAKPQLVQKKGPIHVDIERGFTSSTGDWEISGSGFSIVVRVKDVVNSKNELVIYDYDQDKGQNVFVGELNINLNFDPNSELACDFDKSSFEPNLDIELPMDTPLVCALVGDSGLAPWVYGQVKMNYNYRYRVVETKSIMVETVID